MAVFFGAGAIGWEKGWESTTDAEVFVGPSGQPLPVPERHRRGSGFRWVGGWVGRQFCLPGTQDEKMNLFLGPRVLGSGDSHNLPSFGHMSGDRRWWSLGLPRHVVVVFDFGVRRLMEFSL